MASVHGLGGQARSATRQTASQPGLELLERLGYVVRGALYAAIGIFALGLVLGTGGIATDQSGTLVLLSGGPAGTVLLIAVVAGLGAYSIWGFVRAIFDPLHRGSDPAGIAERLGFAWSGIAYASIALFALHLLAGSGASAHRDGTQTAIGRILALPSGEVIAGGIGLLAIGAGVAQFVAAYRAVFKQDLKRGEMTEAERRIVDFLGRLGFVSRGVIFTIVGWFVLQGAIHHDPSQVHGYGGAFLLLLKEPFGRVLLGFVAAGFVALGLHSFASARWIRLLSRSEGR